MIRHVIGAFERAEDAHAAAEKLVAEGIAKDRISALSWEDPRQGEEILEYDREERTEAIGEGFWGGGALGGLAGLLAGAISLVTVPIGAVAIIGPLASALGGATIGAAVGGFVGSLRKLGLTHDEAERYMEKLENGAVILAVAASQADAPALAERLAASGAAETKLL
jgi:hypothetical protein